MRHHPATVTRSAARTTTAPRTRSKSRRAGAAKARVVNLAPDAVRAAGCALASYAHLQVQRGAVAPVVAWLPDADVEDAADIDGCDVGPAAPTAERRIRDLVRTGWGTLGMPLTVGLMRTGYGYRESVAVLSAAIRDRVVVQRMGGGWTTAA